jgi:hypothetical protein
MIQVLLLIMVALLLLLLCDQNGFYIAFHALSDIDNNVGE